MSFYQQALIVDPSVPGLGAVMSNGAHGVIGGFADLLFTSGVPTLSRAIVSAGQRVTMSSVTVRNAGNIPSGAFSTGWYLSPDNNITRFDRTLATGTLLSGLNPASSRTYDSINLPIPATTTPGLYFLGALTDRLNQVIESNETNNTVVTATQLRVTAPQPDLTITTGSPTVNPSPARAGRDMVNSCG